MRIYILTGSELMEDTHTTPPEEFDFAILTINLIETNAVKEIFGLDKQVMRAGTVYNWSYIANDDGDSVSVVAADTNDKKGDAEMKDLVSRVQVQLNPEHILLLGIAGGLKTRNVKLGDLVVSKHIRYSVSKHEPGTVTPEETPIMPPDKHLIGLANAVAAEKQWSANIEIDRPGRGNSGSLPSFHCEECISGPHLLGDPEDPLLKSLMDKFQRARFVEMEAGGLAHECLGWAQESQYVPYLVIKGISDYADEQRRARQENTDPKRNQAQRTRWARYAARVSAAFSLHLIKKWKRAVHRPIPLRLLLPGDVRVVCNDDCIGILHTVSESDYSKILAHSVKQIMQSRPRQVNAPTIFTVCIYDPRRIWEVVVAEAVRSNPQRDIEGWSEDELLAFSKLRFPHFNLFDQWATTVKTGRLLILNSNENYEARHWSLFRSLNGQVPCWVINKTTLTQTLGVQCISGHATVRGHMVFDFFGDSEMLVVTDVRRPTMGILTRLEQEFWSKTSSSDYIPFTPLERFLADRGLPAIPPSQVT
jgi:nucleoside phosphorylase